VTSKVTKIRITPRNNFDATVFADEIAGVVELISGVKVDGRAFYVIESDSYDITFEWDEDGSDRLTW